MLKGTNGEGEGKERGKRGEEGSREKEEGGRQGEREEKGKKRNLKIITSKMTITISNPNFIDTRNLKDGSHC